MKWGNWIIGACCALFVAVIVTPTGVYEGVWKLATGKDAAAWVQAIGSVLAIFAAVAIAAYQNSREEWRREQAFRTAMFVRTQAAMWVSDLAVTAVRFVPETLKDQAQIPAVIEFGFPKHTFEEAVEAIERLPLHEYEVPHVAVALTLLKTLVRGADQRADLIVERLRNDEEITDEIWRNLQERVADAEQQRDFIHAIGSPSGSAG